MIALTSLINENIIEAVKGSKKSC